ncbi:MAG: PAS domain S-box protein [Pseudomonadota bacterium]|nr:PAS domain S-box protein [Pseudomonadota bacterium]
MTSLGPDLQGLTEALFQAPTGVVLVSPEGRFVRANRAYCHLVGANDDTWLIGQMLTDVVADNAEGTLAALRAALQRGAPSSQPIACTLRRTNGTLVPTEVTFTVVRDGEGRTQHLVGHVQELTGRVRAAPSLHETAGTIERALALAPIGTAILDARFVFREVNEALVKMFGVSREALVGRPYLELLHPDERSSFQERLHGAHLGTLEACRSERRFLHSSGATLHMSLAGAGLELNGEHVYFVLFIDVTEQHTAEDERSRMHEQVLHAERLHTLGQIAGGIAHEVNNPAAIAVGGVDLARRHLTAITSAARTGDLAQVRQQAERLEAALRYCEDGTARLAKVARKLSAFSALHGGEIERMDVNALVRRALDLVQNDLRHRAEVTVDLGELRPLVGHPTRLVQALTNLLVNAAQAIDGLPADHQITVITRGDDTAIDIVVIDTGVGMPSGMMDKIFEPFFTTRGRTDGSGLGLMVVHDVVRQHRGDVRVQSEPGRGSRFIIHLPLANGLGNAGSAPVSPVHRARLLLVDDEPFLLAILAEILGEHEVVTAAGGPEALALLAVDTRFDAVLCDLMMPSVDGIAVHRFLLENAPALASRMVFATGGAFTARAEAYVSSRGVPVLLKPFTAEEVRAVLGTALASEPTPGT